jgi:phosphatidylserine synthase
MKRIVKGIACYEEPVMYWIAKKVYRYVHPDIATAFAIFSSVTGFILYMGASEATANYLWACIPITVHWFCDGIDGKIAKLRQTNRKNGGLIDKVSDFICSVFFISGFFYSTTKNIYIVAILLALYYMVYIPYLYSYFVKKVDVIIGGTEGRIVLIALNVFMWMKTLFLRQ